MNRKRLIISSILYLLAFTLITLFILQLSKSGYTDFLFRFGGEKAVPFNRYGFAFILEILGLSLLLWAIIRIKNYQVTRWILFAILALFLAFTVIILIVAPPGGTEEFIFLFISYAISVPLLIFTFVFKKRKWTKVILIVVLSIFICSSITGAVFVALEDNYEKGWQIKAEVMYDKNDLKRKVLFQEKEDMERFILAEKKVINLYKYQEIEPDEIPLGDWQLMEERFAEEIRLSIPVSHQDDLYHHLENKTKSSLFVTGRITIDKGLVIQGKQDIILLGNLDGGEESTGFLDLESPLIFRDCQDITIKNLLVRGPVKFEYCANVTINGCIFSEVEEDVLFFNDYCTEMEVSECQFSGYQGYAINAPFSALTLSGNDLHANVEDDYPDVPKLNIRNYNRSFSLAEMFSSIACEHLSYYFEEAQYSVHLEYECDRGRFTGTAMNLADVYSISSFVQDYSPGLDINYPSLVEYLNLLSEGILPFLENPVNPNYSQADLPDFYYINPKFIQWWAKHMIPDPDDVVGNSTFQEVYDLMFSDHVGLILETYHWLENNTELESEIDWYLSETNSTEEPNWGLPDLLRKRYRFTPQYIDDYGVVYGYDDYGYEEYGEYEEGYEEEYDEGYEEEYTEGYEEEYDGYEEEIPYESWEYQTGTVAGFWIRRHIDGSADAIYEVLISFLSEYDPEAITAIEYLYNGEDAM